MMQTLTHARLRARQGDRSGARRILRALLAEEPGHAEAQRLLGQLADRGDAYRAEQPQEPVTAPQPARAQELAARFREGLIGPSSTTARPRDGRVARLERWLAGIRAAGAPHWVRRSERSGT